MIKRLSLYKKKALAKKSSQVKISGKTAAVGEMSYDGGMFTPCMQPYYLSYCSNIIYSDNDRIIELEASIAEMKATLSQSKCMLGYIATCH